LAALSSTAICRPKLGEPRDRDVEHRAAHATDQLRLRERRCLEMQAAHRALAHGQRHVVLDEARVDALRGEGGAVVPFAEEAAIVADPLRAHDLDLRNACRLDLDH
jgi:hypothetical protein